MVILGGLVLGFQDSFVKANSINMSFWQFLAIRSSLIFLIVLLFASAFLRIKSLLPRNLQFVIIQSMFVLTCMTCFFSGAVTLDFTIMIAGLYTYPIFICILSKPLLGETLSYNRIFSLVLGILGIWPGILDFSGISLVLIAGLISSYEKIRKVDA